MKNLLLLSLFVASTALAVEPVKPDAKKIESWVGQEEDTVISLLNSTKTKYRFDGAGIKDGTAQVIYNMNNPKKPVPVYFWVSPVSTKVSMISGVLKIPTLKSDESFAFECASANKDAKESTVAVVKMKQKEAALMATKAWNYVTASGKFKETPAKGITCTNNVIF